MTDETAYPQQQAPCGQDWYELEVEGSLSPGWFDWLDGWEIIFLPNGNTLLSGCVTDQPALHGLFAHLRDLNIKIISLIKRVRLPSDETQETKNQD